MKLFRSVLLVTVLSLLAACGKASEPQAVTPASSLAANSVAAIAAPVAEPAAESSPTAEAVATSVNETVETAETSPLPARDIVLPANNPPAGQQTNWQYKEGDYYTVLTSAQGGSSPAGKIEVAEVFWYGCGHCYNLEPVIADWEKRLPSDVNLVRIPVMWNPTNEIHARIFYTAEALGKRAQISPAVFKAIHIDNKPMTDEQEIQKLFAEFGVSADTFSKTFRSFAVESQLRRAKDLTMKYHVKGVPLLVVDGKYLTDGPKIKSHDDLLAVAEELVQRERQNR
ncbi:MAG: thiol:disulfide interchange protein DsbA/DsbL [Gammaproteobacteria bacterium]